VICVETVSGIESGKRKYVRWRDEDGKWQQTTYARVLAAIHIGRPLTKLECAHHVNEDPGDDRLENILVCDWGQHVRLHPPRPRRCVDCGRNLTHSQRRRRSLCLRRWLRREEGRMTDGEFVLSVLSDGHWHSLNDVLRESFAERGCGLTLHSRVADLRKQGHVIEWRKVGPRGAGSQYRLVVPERQLSLEDAA
jgi:hypothetical protein